MLKTNKIAKSISYRIFSSGITFIIAYVLTQNFSASISIGILDTIVKIFSYYFFEELWIKMTGVKNKPCVIFLTGLSGAGKTTIAKALMEKYNKYGIIPVLLDGDEIRKVIQQNGFDEASRKKHNLNVGYMASMLEAQGNIVIVSIISPYADVRNDIRKMCKNFIEVYVCTDIKVCIERDPKGLYVKAISGEIEDFTGISAPYFSPENPEIKIDTNLVSVKESVEIIFKIANR